MRKELENKLADYGTINNVLNVIEDPDLRKNALLDLSTLTKPNAPIIIKIFPGDGTGKGGLKQSGTWQENRKTETYLEEVQQVFPDAQKVAGDYIVATNALPLVSGSDMPKPKRSESMGFKDPNKFGTLEEPTPFGEQDYPYTESVVVEFPDGDTFVEQIKGLNSGHALERAKINFDGAKVRKATRSEELMQEQLNRKEASGSLDYVERYKLERKQLNAPKQTDLKQFFVEQGGVRVPLPDKNFGVGKKIGNDLYVHKSAEDVIPVDILNNARRLIGDFPYDVVKYNKKDNSISFIESPDFDTSPEPIIGNSIKVNADGSVSKPRKGGNVIYHHKWNMVRPDYDGFDYNESMLRSAQWTSALEGTGINRNKIGNKNYWDSNVLPLLGE